VTQQALPSANLQALTFALSIGLGTLQPVFPKPINEDQRKANRRVDFVWTGAPPDPVGSGTAKRTWMRGRIDAMVRPGAHITVIYGLPFASR
jgi:hypothetical protein